MGTYLDVFKESFIKKCLSTNWKLKKECSEQLIKSLGTFNSLKLPNNFIVSSDKASFYLRCWELSFELV